MPQKSTNADLKNDDSASTSASARALMAALTITEPDTESTTTTTKMPPTSPARGANDVQSCQDATINANNDEPATNNDTSQAADSQQATSSVVRYGKCKWFNVAKGWGFITPNDGSQDVFVHQSVIQMDGFRSLAEGEDIEYEAKETDRGVEATRVSGRSGDDCQGSTFHPNKKGGQRRVRCYNCGQFANHIASMCELGPQPKSCHLCREEDHLFADCPLKKAENTSANASANASASASANTSGNESALSGEWEMINMGGEGDEQQQQPENTADAATEN